MPPKENERLKKFLISEDGQKIMLPDEIPEIEIEPDTLNDKIQTFVEEVSKPFNIKCSFFLPVPADELFMVLYGLCTMHQIQQNNWRRLHGLPMRRRRRGRNV